jgi:glucose/mannose-6-phosphate isomerase
MTDVLDTLDMFGAAAGLADQVATAARLAREVPDLPDASRIRSVVVFGMGGSGIGGDVLVRLASPSCPVPIVVSKGYECPAHVGPDTLVFASSFSGNTQETIAAATAAHDAGAQIVVLAEGGELARLAAEWNVPHLPIAAGLPMPRAGIGAVSIPLLVTLDRLGLCEELDAQIDATVAQLRRRIDELSQPSSAAATLARRIGRTMPIVYGDSGIGAVAAMRWKCQFNENPKVPAFANQLPELTHNEICGWAQHGDVTRQVFSLVLLRHDFEHERNRRRFELTAEISDEIVAGVHTVTAEGDGPMAQLFDLIVQGDYVTLELAAQSGVDPGPIPILDGIKAAMSV